MVRYLSLLSYTQQGMTNVKNSPDRAGKFAKTVAAAGGNVASLYWSLGEFDGAILFDAPDEKTAASLLLKLGQEGNVRTKSHRIYDDKEFADIVANA